MLVVIRDAQTGIHAGDSKSDSTEDGKRNYVTSGLMSSIIQMEFSYSQISEYALGMMWSVILYNELHDLVSWYLPASYQHECIVLKKAKLVNKTT